MSDQGEQFIQRVAETLREPVTLRADFDARVMAAVRTGPAPAISPARRIWNLAATPRTVHLSPIAGLALAAGLLMAVVAIGRERDVAMLPTASSSAAATQIRSDTVRLVQFVFVSQDAKSVSLVGDFNDWNKEKTPLHEGADGLWTVSVPLPNGRHQYAFMVNGERWMLDPSAPTAVENSYGTPNSVVTVSEDAL
jgi:hypothetical protein